MHRQDLERMSREQLIAHAERLGIPRPRVLTQPELIDEIIGRTAINERERVKARGWLGRARDLLAKVVERGLHLPEAARVLRQEEKSWPAPPPPLPTVTLAEIYAAQGHYERAIAVIDEVLGREPDHREARSLRERFVDQLQRSRARAGRVDVPPPPPPSAREVKPHRPEKQAAAADPPPAPPPADPPALAEESDSITQVSPVSPVAPAIAVAAFGNDDEAATPVVAGEGIDDAPAEIEVAPADEAREDEPIAPEEAPAPIELEPEGEPPLPQRYEVDEVVAIAVDPRTLYLYWEVRPTTLARARAARPDGELTLRIASITASWEGPVIETRDLHVDALYGDRFVREVQPGSNVRVSLGWKTADDFEPLAVGAEVTAPRAVPVESVAEEVARWEEQPVAPFTSWRPEHDPPPPPHAEDRAFAPFVPRTGTHVPWAPAIAAPHATSVGHGAPVDTGVALWTAPPREEHGEQQGPSAEGPSAEASSEQTIEREIIIEGEWFHAGGASELSRGGGARTRTLRVQRLIPGPGGGHVPPGGLPSGGAGDLRHGGASELSRGGASELGR